MFSGAAWADGSALAWLEAQRPAAVVRLDDQRLAVISHAAAREVLGDSRRFTSRCGTGLHRVEVPGASLNLSDPPVSTALRRLLQPPDVADRERMVRRATELLGAMAARGGGDLVREFAQPFSLGTFGEVFGVEGAQLEDLGRLTRAMAGAPDVDTFRAADAAMFAWLGGQRGLFFGDDVGLSATDALYLRRLIAQTGFESTAMAIALSVEVLLARGLPFDARPAAVDELLRFTSPLIRFAREATEDTVVAGVDVRKGQRVVVYFPAVNRDPAVFTRPGEVLLERAPNPHLAFGAGSHRCFGLELARAQVSAAIEVLGRLPRIRIGPVVPLESTVTRGLLEFPLLFRGEGQGEE